MSVKTIEIATFELNVILVDPFEREREFSLISIIGYGWNPVNQFSFVMCELSFATKITINWPKSRDDIILNGIPQIEN